ncbi:MAG TPA: metalloregulator ArsR/SmtB family transcription factor [Polyangiaceae bacterium]|nr:metalloregulator ArsR/SmtB family transcription factor [Polyangiaceae bacterium]
MTFRHLITGGDGNDYLHNFTISNIRPVVASSSSPIPTRASSRGRRPTKDEALEAGALAGRRWDLYRLLSDPTRLRLLALTAREELAVSELAELLREGQPKVSRHATALRDAALLHGRKQGTWVLLRLAPGAEDDPVISDALAAGRELCEAEGTLERIADVLAARDAATREFFARGGRTLRSGPPTELPAYLRALAPLVTPRGLAIDAGTGDGALLEVLAPLFDRVVAVDRSDAQIELARLRATQRRFDNVTFVQGELDGPELATALDGARADAVFASRILHHAPVPATTIRAIVELARPARDGHPGGAVLVVDYESHRDEALREKEADLWLGFEPDELRALAEEAGLVDMCQGTLPRPWCGDGPDAHLPWQWLSGRRG